VRIAVDATCWHNTRGYGRHARALLSALVRLDSSNKYTLFTDSAVSTVGFPGEAEVQVIQTGTPTAVAASASGRRSAVDMWRVSRAMSHPRFDVVLFPTVYSYVPVMSRARKVVMIHDIIPERYPHLTLPTLSSRLLWRAKTMLGRWQADAVATVSEYSRRGIVQQFRLPADRVFVVGEAPDPVFQPREHPMPTPRLEALGLGAMQSSVVYVGGFGPHKNVATLLAAFARVVAREAFADARLILVGEFRKEVFHSDALAIIDLIEQLKLGSRVVFTGYLPDEDLTVLLNLSTVLVLPSLMEGFGLPAVEAAASGCPVIATTESPLPTLLGEGGLYVDPLDIAQLEAALQRVLGSTELRTHMREAGIAAARRLTWENAARDMRDIVHRVACN
jgi:glycosyltransferase involved in cell wall biosynthesis